MEKSPSRPPQTRRTILLSLKSKIRETVFRRKTFPKFSILSSQQREKAKASAWDWQLCTASLKPIRARSKSGAYRAKEQHSPSHCLFRIKKRRNLRRQGRKQGSWGEVHLLGTYWHSGRRYTCCIGDISVARIRI